MVLKNSSITQIIDKNNQVEQKGEKNNLRKHDQGIWSCLIYNNVDYMKKFSFAPSKNIFTK